jgi:rifampicin phosphotransferase
MDMFMGSKRLTFEAPGPGSWHLDAVHFPHPLSRFQAEIHPPNLVVGFRESFARYGLLVETLQFSFVHGFGYSMPVPAPPSEIPARFEAAARAYETMLWRQDLELWEREVKPAAIRTQLALLAVDPAGLDDAALLAHLERCRDNLAQMVQQHHRFNAAAMLPVGDLIAHLQEWTGRPVGEFLALLRGSAPESAGQLAELDALVAAIRSTPTALALLRGDADPAGVLAELRSMGGNIGASARAYLDLVGYRLLDSLDTGEPYAHEVPEVLVNALRLAVQGGSAAPRKATAADEARVRDLVPAAHRETFDDLLAEARNNSRLRDERGLYSDVWAAGICRRVILEAGTRLAAKGRLQAPAHLVECDYEEMKAVLQGQGGPTAEELAERRQFRDTYKASDAPPHLGDPPHPPPPLDGLPPAPRRAMRAIGAAIDAIFAPSTATSEVTVVRGIGASPGIYTGTARLIANPSEFGRLQRGDVLVTATTTESFNVVLPLLGAIITDAGGLLSHAAIVSREYGIPGVVGCRDATRRITDGATVHVDGVTGEVRLL